MKVSQLIEELSAFDAELPVMVRSAKPGEEASAVYVTREHFDVKLGVEVVTITGAEWPDSLEERPHGAGSLVAALHKFPQEAVVRVPGPDGQPVEALYAYADFWGLYDEPESCVRIHGDEERVDFRLVLYTPEDGGEPYGVALKDQPEPTQEEWRAFNTSTLAGSMTMVDARAFLKYQFLDEYPPPRPPSND